MSFERDFSRGVEVTFDPADDIRPGGGGTYCLASPLATRHIKVQQCLPAGARVAVEADLADGDYRARTVEPGGACDFHVTGGMLPAISLRADGPVAEPNRAAGTLDVGNETAFDRTLVIEDRR
jgi:hypothetical protein